MTVGTLLSYGSTGVCKMVDIRKEKIMGRTMEYYVLSPIDDERTTIFVPTGNEALVEKMRPLLTPDEVHSLINAMPNENCEWIAEDRVRNDRFREILSNGTRTELIRMMRMMHARREELSKTGKRLRTSDSTLLHQAETKLYSEIALVLGMKVNEVESYIEATLNA